MRQKRHIRYIWHLQLRPLLSPNPLRSCPTTRHNGAAAATDSAPRPMSPQMIAKRSEKKNRDVDITTSPNETETKRHGERLKRFDVGKDVLAEREADIYLAGRRRFTRRENTRRLQNTSRLRKKHLHHFDGTRVTQLINSLLAHAHATRPDRQCVFYTIT